MTPEQENEFFLAEISRLSGVPLEEIHMAELARLSNSFRNPTRSYAQVPERQKYLGDRPTSESQASIMLMVEAIGNVPPAFSYGTFIHEYMKMLSNQQQSGGRPDNQALLVGAMTPATVKEFSFIVKSVFPRAKCTAVDLEPLRTETIDGAVANFQIADGLALPTSFNGRFDSVHTNALLKSLQGSGSAYDIESKRRRLFDNFHRVLRPGGRVMMVDAVINNDYWDDHVGMKKALKRSGFSDAQTSSAKRILSRRELLRVMRGEMTDLSALAAAYAETVYTISATKS